MGAAYAQGENYAILLDDGIARCRVWRRPDLSSEECAHFAEEKIAHFKVLASRRMAQGMLLDLSEAPPIVGPQTEAALRSMFAAWEGVARPIAVVAGQSALQRMQIGRVQQLAAPHWGMCFDDAGSALTWLREQRSLARAHIR